MLLKQVGPAIYFSYPPDLLYDYITAYHANDNGGTTNPMTTE